MMLEHSAIISLAALVGLFGCGGRASVDERDGGVGSEAPPRTESCGNGLDDDRNGRIDDGCPCGPGEEQSCFSGELSADGVGECQRGEQRCNTPSGSEWGDWGDFSCTGAVAPTSTDSCNGLDDDCDGSVDEACPCPTGATTECGTEFVQEPCRPGRQVCRDGVWSACEGSIGPTPEICDDRIDNDCDGSTDPRTLCDCVPEPEVCRDDVDNDCDGLIDEPECRPDWPPDGGTPSGDGGVRLDGGEPRVGCEQLAPATGTEWRIDSSHIVSDGSNESGFAAVYPVHADVDRSGNTFVAGMMCEGTASIAGFSVSSFAVVRSPFVTCNPFVIALDPAGSLRWGWQPILADLDPPPAGAGAPLAPNAHATAVAADHLGGVWLTGWFEGRLTIDGVMHEETTEGQATNGFLVHLDASGRIVQQTIVGERASVETVEGVALTEGGDPVVWGRGSAIFSIGSGIVRNPSRSYFVAQIDPAGSPRWVVTTEHGDVNARVHFGSVSIAENGDVVAVGGANGSVRLGESTIHSEDRDRGHAWLWRLSAGDGSTRTVRAWQSSVGYYAHLERASAYDDFVGTAGTLRGRITVGDVALEAGSGIPEEPRSDFVLAFESESTTWGRAFTTTPFDAFHGVDVHLGWNTCRETMAVAEGLQGSRPVSDPQVDFGSGLVGVPQDVVQLVQWDRSGSLQFRTPRTLGGRGWQVRHAAWSPRERAVVVLGHTNYRSPVTTGSIWRFAFR